MAQANRHLVIYSKVLQVAFISVMRRSRQRSLIDTIPALPATIVHTDEPTDERFSSIS
jgi:hypothetical protein